MLYLLTQYRATDGHVILGPANLVTMHPFQLPLIYSPELLFETRDSAEAPSSRSSERPRAAPPCASPGLPSALRAPWPRLGVLPPRLLPTDGAAPIPAALEQQPLTPDPGPLTPVPWAAPLPPFLSGLSVPGYGPGRV